MSASLLHVIVSADTGHYVIDTSLMIPPLNTGRYQRERADYMRLDGDNDDLARRMSAFCEHA